MMNPTPNVSSEGAEERPMGSSLLTLLSLLWAYRKTLVSLPLIAGVIGLLVALALPNWYLATAKIMPPQSNQSNPTALLGQLGALPGVTQALALKNPSDIYVAILKSRTVGDRLIDRFKLLQVYDEELMHDTRRELSRNSFIAAGRDGVITIEVEDRDPGRAADLANAYIEELRNLTLTLAVSEASQRRLFFEGQLEKAKKELASAEIALQKFTQEAGLVNPQGQITLSVSAAVALRAQIAAKQIQLSSMRTFATDSNPEIHRTTQELLGLQGELAKLERNSTSMKGDVLVPFGKAPEVGLEYVRRYREMKYFETLFDVVAKQYEMARIDEAKDATIIQVLDLAIPPERKSRPRVLLTTVLSAIAAFLAALFLIYTIRQLSGERPVADLRAAFREQRG